jgi:hypothetical protein
MEMPRGKSSGITLSNTDASLVLGMVARDDREHDIAAWFGVNQGRIAEVKSGSFGSVVAATASQLPPKGPPGRKGRRLHAAVKKALLSLEAANADGVTSAITILRDAKDLYEKNEA